MDPAKLERMKARRLKEIKQYAILREIALYSVFLWTVIAISYDFRKPEAFLIKDNLVKVFVKGGNGQPNLDTVDLSSLYTINMSF